MDKYGWHVVSATAFSPAEGLIFGCNFCCEDPSSDPSLDSMSSMLVLPLVQIGYFVNWPSTSVSACK